jgi:arylsulfatase A-like enzyme
MIESMDTQIGRVLEAPDANGLTENTIVISLIQDSAAVGLVVRPLCPVSECPGRWLV